MAANRSIRTLDDLERTVRALATEFKTDKVFIIGSQSILLTWPDAPTVMRDSAEVDAYPENAKLWEIEEQKKHPGAEASEHVNGLFGIGSQFHQTHGFYIDGVDENTATLPAGWQERAITRPMFVGMRRVFAVAPSPEDLIVSKLARLDPKDKDFIEAYHTARPLDLAMIEKRIGETKMATAIAERALGYIRGIAAKSGGNQAAQSRMSGGEP